MVRVMGDRVRALRQECGLSQAQLATKAELMRAEVCRVEKDARPGMQAVAVGRLAAALDTTSDYLLGLTADPATALPEEWRVDPAHMQRIRRLIERLVRLPREEQDRIMDAVLTLMRVSEVVDGHEVEARSLFRIELPPDHGGR